VNPLDTDKVDVVASITSTLAKRDTNIVDILQTAVKDIFSMAMIDDMSKADVYVVV